MSYKELKDKTQDPTDGEETSQDPSLGEVEQAPKTDAHEAVKGEDVSQDPKAVEAKPNAHKLERDVANRDKTIEQQNAQIEELTRTIEELKKQVESITEESTQAKQEKLKAELDSQGCVDADVALTLLDSVDGDVAKLKEQKPYLFQASKQVRTSGKQVGTSTGVVQTIAEAFRN